MRLMSSGWRRKIRTVGNRLPATTAPIFAGLTIASVETAAVRDAASEITWTPCIWSTFRTFRSRMILRLFTPARHSGRKSNTAKSGHRSICRANHRNKRSSMPWMTRTKGRYFGFPRHAVTDVLDYIHQRYSKDVIPAFILDQAALKDAGIDPTTTLVTISVKDISLRSALKLILQPVNLTYDH